MEKSKYQVEFDALPEWARKLVTTAAKLSSYGYGTPDYHITGELGSFEFTVTLPGDVSEEWSAGWGGLLDLAEALTAPWPPPEAPPRERRAENLVEMTLEDEEECAFDQPCCFGNRVDGHAVYCHNEAWPNAPRKCRRTWYSGGKVRDEDCPGYVANPDFVREEKTKDTQES